MEKPITALYLTLLITTLFPSGKLTTAWKRPPPVDILETSTWPIVLYHEEDNGMSLDFELGGDNDIVEYDSGDLVTARETYEQYLEAGILFPEEIRNAERILRHLEKLAMSQKVSMTASEKIPV
jgi:hypothetical protein